MIGKNFSYLIKIIYRRNIVSSEDSKLYSNLLRIKEDKIEFLNGKKLKLYKIQLSENLNDVTWDSIRRDFKDLIESGTITIYSYMSKWEFSKSIKKWNDNMKKDISAKKEFIISKIEILEKIQKEDRRIFVVAISEKETKTISILKKNYIVENLDSKEIREFQDNFFNFETTTNERFSCLTSNDRYYKYICITQFPKMPEVCWFQELLSKTKASVFLSFDQVGDRERREFFNSAISNEESSFYSKRDKHSRAIQEENIDILEQAMQITVSGESSIINTKIILRFEDSDIKSLEKKIKAFRDSISSDFKFDYLKNNQLTTLKYTSHYNNIDYKSENLSWPKRLFRGFKRLFAIPYFEKINSKLLSSSIAQGFPLNDSDFIEDMGDFIGSDEENNPVMPNFQLITQYRPAFNAIISGKNGMGKTAFIIEQIKNNWLKGNIVSFVPDYKKDYENIFRVMTDEAISIRPGTKNGNINMFDLYEGSIRDENSMEDKINLLSSILKILTEWIEEIDIARVKRWLIELYKKINSPRLEDLYNLVKQKKDTKSKEFCSIIENYVSGSEKRWFNNKTDIDFNNKRLIRFDLEEVTQISNNSKIQAAFNLIMLDWMKKELIKNGTSNKKKKESNNNDSIIYTMIYADEGHIISNNSDTSTLELLNRTAKTARSYYGGVWFSTQNFSDILKVDKTDASAIFNNATTWIFFGSGADDLSKLNQQFQSVERLQEDEIAYLNEQKRGQALFITSGRRIKLETRIDPLTLKIINFGG
jgi:hypothetical protein